MRTTEALEPIASRIAMNTALMGRFRSVLGSDNKETVRKMIDEIAYRANEIDSSIGLIEGVQIALILAKQLGHFTKAEDKSNRE